MPDVITVWVTGSLKINQNTFIAKAQKWTLFQFAGFILFLIFLLLLLLFDFCLSLFDTFYFHIFHFACEKSSALLNSFFWLLEKRHVCRMFVYFSLFTISSIFACLTNALVQCTIENINVLNTMKSVNWKTNKHRDEISDNFLCLLEKMNCDTTKVER